MPEKMRVMSYLVGASLATAALIYIIGPDHVLPSTSPIGLSNRANDCFINSVLQALAGIPEMREYLIRETHRRTIDPAVYESEIPTPAPAFLAAANGEESSSRPGPPVWKLRGLREGIVTRGLKAMLDALNEKPRSRKSIAPTAFIEVLQVAFRQLISRQQQDAHEFLQIVAQRLEEEYAMGRAARLHHASQGLALGLDGVDEEGYEHVSGQEASSFDTLPNGNGNVNGNDNVNGNGAMPKLSLTQTNNNTSDHIDEGDLGFPMHGRIESQIECKTCGYRTKPRQEDFYILTLNVPRQSSTTLDECFRQQFRSEEIEDYRCDKCRLIHLHDRLRHEARPAQSSSSSAPVQDELTQLDHAITHDPESLPEGTPLTRGLEKDMPKRTVVRTSRISRHPRVLVVHLSRSIFSGGSQKNAAKVSFPERLMQGTLAEPCTYRLLSVVMHRGSHDSGHYDSFRRQMVATEPYPNQSTFRPSGVYSRAASRAPSRNPSRPASSGHAAPPSLQSQLEPGTTRSTETSSPSLSEDASLLSPPLQPRTTPPSEATLPLSSLSTSTSPSPSPSPPVQDQDKNNNNNDDDDDDGGDNNTRTRPKKKKKKPPKLNKWWRISDEKVKEARTDDVLGMQREVYMLFYELEKPTTTMTMTTTTTAITTTQSQNGLVDHRGRKR